MSFTGKEITKIGHELIGFEYESAEITFLLDSINKMLDDRKEIYSSYMEEFEGHIESAEYRSNYSHGFIDRIAKSVLIMQFSTMDTYLKRISEFVYINKPEVHLKFADKAGDFLNEMKKYLEDIGGIQFKTIQEEWDQIKYWNYLRNCIVHRDSSYMKHPNKPKEKQPYYSSIKKDSYLAIEDLSDTFQLKTFAINKSLQKKFETLATSICDQIEKLGYGN